MIPDNNSKKEKKGIITPLARGFNFSRPTCALRAHLGLRKQPHRTLQNFCKNAQAHPKTLCLQKNCNQPQGAHEHHIIKAFVIFPTHPYILTFCKGFNNFLYLKTFKFFNTQ